MTHPVAWKNGKVLPFADLSLHVSDLGVVAGASISEMARTFAHKTFRLSEHIQRLLESCTELGFPMEYSAAELLSAAENLVVENCRLIAANDDLGIVAFATAGANRTYLGVGELPKAVVAIHTFRLPLELWKPAAQHGVNLTIPRRTQVDSSVLPVHRKVRNRLHWWLADREADEINPGSRALLLDSNGLITETSNGCFYGVLNGEIVTPRANVLDSMSRRIVEEAAHAAGIVFCERDLQRSEVNSMSEAFLSSTPFGVLPVRSIDNKTFNETGAMVSLLNNYWKQITGINPAMQIASNG